MGLPISNNEEFMEFVENLDKYNYEEEELFIDNTELMIGSKNDDIALSGVRSYIESQIDLTNLNNEDNMLERHYKDGLRVAYEDVLRRLEDI